MSAPQSVKTLVIAFGNRDRQDDGAGWHILAQLSAKLGLQAPDSPGEWVETKDGNLRLLYLYQLLPEMAEDLINYAQVGFLDAHNSAELPQIIFQPVNPAWQRSAFTHHLPIGELLAITQTIYGRCPQSWMLSVRGYAFEFSQTLSPRTAALVHEAVELLYNHLLSGAPPIHSEPTSKD